MQTPLLGIDLGGTKIEGVVLKSKENPEVLARLRVKTEASMGYFHILSNIKTLIENLEVETGILAEQIGIGTPGVLDPLTGTMKNCNTTCLNGQALKKDLETYTGKIFFIANDANCFAMAETHMGIIKQLNPLPKIVFGIIMGTGVGGGLVVDGKTITGLHGIGGEWGHIFLDESGGQCYCGKKGCVETLISGPALEKHYQKLSGQNKSVKEIFNIENQQLDEFAKATKAHLLEKFGKAVSYLINIVDPDAIVIGGGVGNLDCLYDEGRPYILKNLFNNTFNTPMVKPDLGDSAGVFGAAFLIEQPKLA